MCLLFLFFFFFFNDTATTEIYTLSLHDALPISSQHACPGFPHVDGIVPPVPDRKSTRLNSSHQLISYAVFCLKKKKKKRKYYTNKHKNEKKINIVREQIYE